MTFALIASLAFFVLAVIDMLSGDTDGMRYAFIMMVLWLNNFSIDLLSENLKEIRRDLKDVKSRPPVYHYGGERKSKLLWREDDIPEG